MATMLGRTETATDAARWATVQVETEGGTYVGRLSVPAAHERVSEVLADGRQFLSLAGVRMNDGAHVVDYLALNKSFVRRLRILDEGTAAAARGQISMVPSR